VVGAAQSPGVVAAPLGGHTQWRAVTSGRSRGRCLRG
jgi:hypothetical protein